MQFPLPPLTVYHAGSRSQLKNNDPTYLSFSYNYPPLPCHLPYSLGHTCVFPVPNDTQLYSNFVNDLDYELPPLRFSDPLSTDKSYIISQALSVILSHASHLPRLLSSLSHLVYSIITFGIPKRYYIKYGYDMHHSLPLTNHDLELLASKQTKQLVDGWKTLITVSSGPIFNCITALMQLLGTDYNSFYRTTIMMSLLCASGSLLVNMVCIGYMSDFRSTSWWIKIISQPENDMWGVLALPAILLAWSAIFFLFAVLWIDIGKLPTSIPDIISTICIAITLFMVISAVCHARSRIRTSSEINQLLETLAHEEVGR